MDTLAFTVQVRLAEGVEQADLDYDDHDVNVEEDYVIELPGEAAGWSASRQAHEVLNEFHDNVGIHTLDDFVICVFGPDGVEILEDFDDDGQVIL